jgi:hypothetical protein
MKRGIAVERTDVSEERIASINKVTRIGELGTTLSIPSNRNTLRRNQMLHLFQLEEGYSSTQSTTPGAANQEDQATVYNSFPP